MVKKRMYDVEKYNKCSIEKYFTTDARIRFSVSVF